MRFTTLENFNCTLWIKNNYTRRLYKKNKIYVRRSNAATEYNKMTMIYFLRARARPVYNARTTMIRQSLENMYLNARATMRTDARSYPPAGMAPNNAKAQWAVAPPRSATANCYPIFYLDAN